MPSGHVAAAAADALGAALDRGACMACAVDGSSGLAASGAGLPLPSIMTAPAPSAMVAPRTTPMMTPVLLLAAGVPVDSVEGELVVFSVPRGATPMGVGCVAPDEMTGIWPVTTPGCS